MRENNLSQEIMTLSLFKGPMTYHDKLIMHTIVHQRAITERTEPTAERSVEKNARTAVIASLEPAGTGQVRNLSAEPYKVNCTDFG